MVEIADGVGFALHADRYGAANVTPVWSPCMSGVSALMYLLEKQGLTTVVVGKLIAAWLKVSPWLQASKQLASSANPSTTMSVAGFGMGSGGPAGPHSSGRRTKAVR
jgi:hypothetical protein